jgi:capsule biosynthesis phosphatase
MTSVPRRLYVDLDGTLCPVKAPDQKYEDLPVYEKMRDRLRAAKDEGYEIIIYTARNVRTHNGDLSRLIADTAPKILAWLDRHKVPYDGLIVGKPWAGPDGFFIDDRAVRPSEFVEMKTDAILVMLGKSE